MLEFLRSQRATVVVGSGLHLDRAHFSTPSSPLTAVDILRYILHVHFQAIRETIRDWRLDSLTRNNQSLEEIAGLVNPSVRGWAELIRPVLGRRLAQGDCTISHVPHSTFSR